MIRLPAVADVFYPADKTALHAEVVRYLDAAGPRLKDHWSGAAPKALIVPHAGYVYSGPIAASAYATLSGMRNVIKRVVLAGPAHRIPFSGLAVSSAQAFRTPLGDVPVDQAAAREIAALSQVVTLDAAHAQEHCLEVQLPFLLEMLSAFTLVPLVVGDTDAGEVSEVLEHLWGGPETLLVISSDLSHYLDYAQARALDAQTAAAIEALRPELIGGTQACGRLPIQGLLLAAAHRGLIPERLDLRNSGDTAGGRGAVVGYGAFAFVPALSTRISRGLFTTETQSAQRTTSFGDCKGADPKTPSFFSLCALCLCGEKWRLKGAAN